MGTIFTLANMARFIIADLTDPSSVPYELGRLVPNTKVPVQTIILEGQREFAMFVDLKSSYHWVLEPYPYKSKELLSQVIRSSSVGFEWRRRELQIDEDRKQEAPSQLWTAARRRSAKGNRGVVGWAAGQLV